MAARSNGVGAPPLAYWDCVFEYRRGYGCLSVVSVVCCQVERPLSRADHSSRGFLPSVVCLSVILKINMEEVLSH